MTKKIYILALGLAIGASSCQKSDFEEYYANPAKLSETTVEKQFTGVIYSNRDYVLPSYWNYFVVHRITNNRYTQAVGWVNTLDQYVPGGSAVNDRWKSYYRTLTEYRELQKVYGKLSVEEQALKRIYLIAAATYLYDHTQQVVDLHGDIPFSEAGLLNTNGGEYPSSYAKYDTAESIYTKILDDLKGFAEELNSTTVNAGVLVGFKAQDFINNGDLTAWKRYINSLRLRMLTRVSGASSFSGRAQSEIAQILANPNSYPIVTTNAENVQIEVTRTGMFFNDNDEFRRGLEDWSGNVAGKKIIDHMVKNKDPRLTYVFESGLSATPGTYLGLDPLLNISSQTELVNGSLVSTYNRSTLSRNTFFPGILFNAAQVNFILAEYYLNNNNPSAAQAAYEKGIRESFQFFKDARAVSTDNSSPVPAVVSAADITAYINSVDVNWAGANTNDAKLGLIALQKWLHFNVIQPNESWAEVRRLKKPSFTFWVDESSNQKNVPARWNYPNDERAYNATNYGAVSSKDNLSAKLFWDIK